MGDRGQIQVKSLNPQMMTEYRNVNGTTALVTIGRHHSVIGSIETQVRRMDVSEFYEYCEILGLEPRDCFQFIKAWKTKKNMSTGKLF
ncbi:hypothetical protein MD535_24795 [Vibrio sp. ZSDZ65]|uniref:Uncharacterized protein n=1 Tax=Vibrio qingdaonensis TaxID=2829491 RepID=A0A9X3HZC9_9VIBR|nr:hypothetical protein [Vibrio qingdaonensis]MCW8349208.1 hypothetical protein [Vibrio qingdaonensis]